jgi:hypothetical protein
MNDEIISIVVRFSTHNQSAIFSGESWAWSSSRRSEMLQKLNDEVRECYAHAKDCARKAAAQLEPAVRQSFLDAEQCWLRLVRRLASVPEPKGE